MIVGVPREIHPGERRVALVPAVLASLANGGFEMVVESGAGSEAGYSDAAFEAKGARIEAGRQEVFGAADVILQIRSSAADLRHSRPGQIIIGFFDPLSAPAQMEAVAAAGVTAFSMELMPRLTRAQSMDALSSMATIGGYKAVIMAANHLPRMFPMLMTAAGTITPAKVFVIGAGVAGLQAISAARRLGGVVEAYDVRPAVREQVVSVGAKFVELPIDTGAAEDRGGYAKAQDESFYRRQQEMMARVVAASDVIITTAAIPGRRAPVLVSTAMVEQMAPGSVIVDLAAERGGNCELTRADEMVIHHGVTILGPTNLPSTVPYHASQMYAKNVGTFLLHIAKGGTVNLDTDDPIVQETLLCHGGRVVNPRLREALETSAKES
jgi:H+-translocating NAD(P) transhydrogenase subunit alpha